MNKVLLLTAICFASFASLHTSAQSKKTSKFHIDTKGISLGYQKGFETNLNHTASFRTTNRAVIRTFVTENWSLETGLVSTTFGKTVPSPSFSGKMINTLSVPVSAQYNFKTKSKVHPYCGAGVICNLTNGTVPAPKFTDGVMLQQAPNNKVNLLLSQGTTIEINTKLQFTESIHFIPQADNNILGVDIGIGFKL